MMKRFVSANNINMIAYGKYNWRVINDEQYGEFL